MLEIESKYPLADHESVVARLEEWGAVPEPPRTETDHYFNAPDRDFARTGEAFRLRRVGEENFLTYKGPKRGGPTKTRFETEIPIAPGDGGADEMSQLLVRLKFRPVETVTKTRRIYSLTLDGFDVAVCLDAVVGLGRFAEVEILAPEDRLEAAQSVILSVAGRLGLGEPETRSYLRMVLESKAHPAGPATVPTARTIAEVRDAVARARGSGSTVGLVPTMGALHRGHVALIEAARREADFVVVSVFVNPTQFGAGEDLDRYPRQLERDREICARAGASLVFAPPPEEVYPPDFTTWVEVPGLSDVLCGPSRPGHFRGVATVVLKLLNIVGPDLAVFGKKDAQQARVIEQMVADLNVPVRIQIEPTVREEDGLALSSRNQYLSESERARATVLSRALIRAEEAVRAGERDAARIEALLAETVREAPEARLDYARVLDARSLGPIERIDRPALAALAVYFGRTRLIDNIELRVAD